MSTNHPEIRSSSSTLIDRENEFDEKLVIIIHETLKKSFGESSLLIYSWLRIHSVNPEEIPEKLDAFSDTLKTFSAGALVLETIILRDLYSSYGFEFEQTNNSLRFKDRIITLKRFLKNQRRTHNSIKRKENLESKERLEGA
jgi:alanyl-tRNA synthetase